MATRSGSSLKRLPIIAFAGIAASLAIWLLATPHDIPHGTTAPNADAAELATAGRRPSPRSGLTGGAVAEGDAFQRRIDALEKRLAEESARREEMRRRIDELSDRLAALQPGEPPSTDTASHDAAYQPPNQGIDYSKNPMQRALEAAGLDEAAAQEIKLRGDRLAMSEMYLRDQAAREGWLDTPRFKEEMAEIEAQRISMRDEIGDDAYDRYLFALGHTNRVIVNDVMLDSVAENVGLREGDLIVSYGDTRIFATEDLIEATQGGSSGEPVVLQVMRNGEPMQIEVPRGPLGLRIGPAQDDPDR